MNKRLLTDMLKREIYKYDDTYKIEFKKVLHQLIDNHKNNINHKLREVVVNALMDEWYTEDYNDYIFSRVDFDIIIRAMKEDIKQVMGERNIKLILRSFCYYNGGDGICHHAHHTDDKIMFPIHEIDDNNGYYEDDTLKTIRQQIFKWLKDVIDDTKLKQFLTEFIDDNDIMTLDSYLMNEKYEGIKRGLIEEDDTFNVFRNYDFVKQKHLYNIRLLPYYQSSLEYYKKVAEQVYINRNGLNDDTIQIVTLLSPYRVVVV
jgi:hypothetical protein